MKSLKPREKWLAVATVLVIVIFIGDQFVLTPAFKALDDLSLRQTQLSDELDHAARVIRQRHDRQELWERIVAGGLVNDRAESERRVLDAVRRWSRESGLEVVSIQPERPTSQGTLRETGFQASARGTMESITRFMYAIEQAELPIRVQRVRLASVENTAALSLELRFSTLYRAEAAK